LLFALGAHALGASALVGGDGVSNEDKTLLNCLEQVSYVEVFV
jgi:hypothetical protein